MRTKIWIILLLAIVSVSIGLSGATINSNQNPTVYIGGSPPDIIDEPADYLLTTSDIQAQISIDRTINAQEGESWKDGTFTCKPSVKNGQLYGGYYSGQPNYCEGKKIMQSFQPLPQFATIYNVQGRIIGLHPSVTDYDAIIQNIKDTYSIGSNYKASFENLPQLGGRSFFMPATFPLGGGSGYDNTLVVQSGNIIVMISGTTVEEGKNSKDLLIDFARKYLTKISQVRNNQPNLIIQASADKTVLEVGDYYNSGGRFDIEFKSTATALITVKNGNQIIDSFVLEHSDRRSYIADKASGNEMIEITGVTAKGKTDATQLRITTKDKATPTPTPIQTPIKKSPGFGSILSIFLITLITATLSIIGIIKKRKQR